MWVSVDMLQMVSSWTSNFIVGSAQEFCFTDLDKCKVNPIRGDGLTDAKRIDGKRGAESACLKLKCDRCKGNQRNSKVANGRRAGSVCLYIYIVSLSDLLSFQSPSAEYRIVICRL